ncbi:hypothetical protein N7536_000763 [Penicillium majusculum]|nr:hypothetical protein N7536_000763 [Penicillium majusculum]
MLWMALDADQLKTPLIIQQLIRPRVNVARRNSQEKTCSPAETLPVKNCPSGRTPRANDNWITLFGADIPCNVTKTSERHERPFTCVFGCHTGCRRGRSGMLKPRWAGPILQGTFSALSATVYVARVLFRVGEHSAKSRTLAFPSDVISTVMRRCRKFDLSMQSLETLNNRTVEACYIYLPDDGFTVNGVQDCCQPSLAPGHRVCAG